MCSEILGKMSTKKDGKTVKEAHEKLKVNNIFTFMFPHYFLCFPYFTFLPI